MTRSLTILVLLSGCAVAAAAQDDSVYYIHGLPHTIEDTADFPASDRRPADSFQRLSPAQIPSRVREALDDDELYRNWEDGELLFDRNTSLYHVNLAGDSTVRSYIFNKRGMVVSYREYDSQ